jgi:hypothetical protein
VAVRPMHIGGYPIDRDVCTFRGAEIAYFYENSRGHLTPRFPPPLWITWGGGGGGAKTRALGALPLTCFGTTAGFAICSDFLVSSASAASFALAEALWSRLLLPLHNPREKDLPGHVALGVHGKWTPRPLLSELGKEADALVGEKGGPGTQWALEKAM